MSHSDWGIGTDNLVINYGGDFEGGVNIQGPKVILDGKHLPEVPSAKEMEENGLNLKEMNLLLLKKVEELTLHLIAIEKENAAQQKEIEKMKKKIKGT